MTMADFTPSSVAVVGAGAVGGWVGGQLARAGLDVVLIDAWPDHVEALRRRGIELVSPDASHLVPVRALHIGEVQSLHRQPVDLAFLCVKLYDTAWAAALIDPYLSPSGFLVTLQNGLIEDSVAAVVGWERTVGCIGGGLYLRMDGPGVIRRNRQPVSGKEGGKGSIFQVGEVHGRSTPRLRTLAALMQHVDATGITSNLWGARWSKLVANCMTSALCGVSGLTLRELHMDSDARRVMLRLAGEAVAVGAALGFCIEDVFGLAPERWLAAAGGDAAAAEQAADAFRGLLPAIAENSRPGIAQDLAKGRRTEIDYMNGYVAARARECGLAAPTHAGLAALVADIERGARAPAAGMLHELLGEA